MDKETKKFYKELKKELEKDEPKRENRVKYITNLASKLKRKYEEDKNLSIAHRIDMLTLAIFQIEPAIMEINTLSEFERNKLKAEKYELQKLSSMFTEEAFKLKKDIATLTIMSGSNPPSEDNIPKSYHNNIFKDDAHSFWLILFDAFNINETSRSDVKFIYEEMKKNHLIHKSVIQTKFLEWLGENHGLIIEKTSNYNRTPKRIAVYQTALKAFNSKG